MLTFLHCVTHLIYGQKERNFELISRYDENIKCCGVIQLYTKLIFKMKLGFECFNQKKDLREILIYAIQKTINEIRHRAI